jgi:hypothetical protein
MKYEVQRFIFERAIAIVDSEVYNVPNPAHTPSNPATGLGYGANINFYTEVGRCNSIGNLPSPPFTQAQKDLLLAPCFGGGGGGGGGGNTAK